MNCFDRVVRISVKSIFLLLFIFFSVFTAITFAFSAKWLLLNTKPVMIPVIILSISALGVATYFFLKFIFSHLARWGHVKVGLFICGVALLLRILVGLVFTSLDYTMSSDYLYAYEAATGSINAIPAVPIVDYSLQWEEYIHFVYAPYWGHYIALMHTMTRFFCHTMFLNNFLNAIADTSIVWLIIAIMQKLFKSPKPGVAAAAIYALYPTTIIYCNWFCGEFLGIAFAMLGLWCMMSFLSPWCGNVRNPIKSILLTVAAGVFLGMSNIMKPVIPLIFMSLVVFEFSYFFRGISTAKVKVKAILANLTLIALTTCVTLFTDAELKKCYSRYTGYHENPSPLEATLFKGLNTQYHGMFHKNLFELALRVAQDTKGDPEKITMFYKNALKELLKNSMPDMPELFVRKAVLIFGNEAWPVDRIASGIKKTHPEFRESVTGKLCYQWSNLYYGIILCGVTAMFLFMSIRLHRPTGGVWICLFIIMGTTMQMLIEAQPRYRVSFLNPFMIMAAGYSLQMLSRIITRRISKQRSSRNITRTPSA